MGKGGSSKHEAQLLKQMTKMVLKVISFCSTTCCAITCIINFSSRVSQQYFLCHVTDQRPGYCSY